MSTFTKDKLGEAIKSKIAGLLYNDTFILNERPLPADGNIPTILAYEINFNVYGDIDKLMAGICLRGDIQIKTALFPGHLPPQPGCWNVFIADDARFHPLKIQLDFMISLIQSKATSIIFVILDEEFSHFCPNLLQHFRRPNKYLDVADFSGKSWYDSLDVYLVNEISFKRSRVDGCLYI